MEKQNNTVGTVENPTKSELNKRIADVYKKEVELYKEAKIRKIRKIVFEKGDKVPTMSKIALWIINKQGGKFMTIFEDMKKK